MSEVEKSKDRSLEFHSEEFDQSLYQGVSMDARLREVRLTNSQYIAKIGKYLQAEYSDDVSLQQSFFGEPRETSFSPERGILAGTYRWVAEVKSGRTKVIKLSTEYLVLYSGLTDHPEDYCNLYFKKIARFTTYPYFRSHFAEHISQSGLALAPLPSLTERVD